MRLCLCLCLLTASHAIITLLMSALHNVSAQTTDTTSTATNNAAVLTPATTSSNSESTQIRGVNIGGWLVLEPFIRPSLFNQFRRGGENTSYYLAQDEFSFCQVLGPDECSRQLNSHWNNWFIENDVKLLAEAGITHLRIPIGYWSIIPDPNAPYVAGALSYMLRAFGWAREYGLKVWVDLHGAPGSQNGWNHSGHQGETHMFEPDNEERTLQVLRELHRIITQPQFKDIVVGLEVLNEPGFMVDVPIIQSFYTKAYNLIRNELKSDIDLAFSDSFRASLFEGFFSNMTNVWVDQHTYFIFSDGGLLTSRQAKITTLTCGASRDAVIRAEKTTARVMTGEWSLADTDCTPWLNSVNVGARWDGTIYPNAPKMGNCTGDWGINYWEWSTEYKQFLSQYFQAQMQAYEAGSGGWFFWNFKAELPSAVHWNFLFGVQQGWINLRNLTYSCDGKV